MDNEIVTAFQVREKKLLGASADTMAQLRTALVGVVNGPSERRAGEPRQCFGRRKTGTAQWGPKHKERTAAWFAGFVPADKPQMAFAAVCGDVGASVHGGVMRRL